MFLTSLAAGAIGSIVGIGGGLLVTPVLTLIFGVDIHLAIGASIIAIIATSSGGAVAYIKDRITNIRVGMYLEMATTVGAITGAAIAAYVNSDLLFGFFGAILLFSVFPLLRKRSQELPHGVVNDHIASTLQLNSSYPELTTGQEVSYNVEGSVTALFITYVAGLLSGLLGIGAGAFKVLGMENAMHLPMKVSTTTSNFMIGVTAAASAGIYFVRGDVNPFIVAPVVLGILGGAIIGTRILVKSRNSTVRKFFIVVLVGIAIEMIARAFGVMT